MGTYRQRQLRRVADALGMGTEEFRDVIATIVGEHTGYIRRERSDTPRVTGCREVYGEGHAAVSFISDPLGTDVVPPGYEQPPGYSGP